MIARALLPLALAATARHPPPTLHFQAEVLPGRVTAIVTGELQVWNEWFGLDIGHEFLMSEQDVQRMLDAAKVFFREKNPVHIDGQRVLPVVESVVPPADFNPRLGMPNIVINMHYPCEGTPRQVDFRWDEFRETDWFERKAVPAMIKFQGDVDQAVFTPAEPQFIWHTREVRPRSAPAVVAVEAPPPIQFLLPLASIAFLAGTLVLIPFARRVAASPKLAWGLVATGVLGAFLLRDTLGMRVDSPFGVSIPPGDRAMEIFETLHGNIYRAFAARSEDEIYDLLAVSVDKAILDELYADVYESLILRGQGGAVCNIERVEILERDVELGDEGADRPGFDVDWSWRVHGVVSHWGHEHRRTNQYRARYHVAHDGRAWRIAKVRVLDHSRVDRDG